MAAQPSAWTSSVETCPRNIAGCREYSEGFSSYHCSVAPCGQPAGTDLRSACAKAAKAGGGCAYTCCSRACRCRRRCWARRRSSQASCSTEMGRSQRTASSPPGARCLRNQASAAGQQRSGQTRVERMRMRRRMRTALLRPPRHHHPSLHLNAWQHPCRPHVGQVRDHLRPAAPPMEGHSLWIDRPEFAGAHGLAECLEERLRKKAC